MGKKQRNTLSCLVFPPVLTFQFQFSLLFCHKLYKSKDEKY